jgi:hypothetical protein
MGLLLKKEVDARQHRSQYTATCPLGECTGLHVVPSQALMIVVLAVGLSAPLERACRQNRLSATW